MNFKKQKKDVKKAWNWIWNSDSPISWVIALILIYIIIKLIFFPVISLVMGTSLPLAGVESSSMDHQVTKYCEQIDERTGKCIKWSSNYEICGNIFLKEDKEHLNFEEYWENCGNWYDKKKISKYEFEEFPLKNGFKKGDVIIVWGRFTPKIGDIVIFQANAGSQSPYPIIHRIVNINEEGIIQTKGDHNEKQLTKNNNRFETDETYIQENQLIGKAIIKIPYLGYPKIWLTDIINVLRR